MSTANMAGILGLLLGGAGGYYGGKRRASKADEQWEKYADLQRELAAMEQGSTVDPATPPVSIPDLGDAIGHPGRETELYPDVAPNPYEIDAIDLLPEGDRTVKEIFQDWWSGDTDPTSYIYNEGGVVPKRGLVDEPGGYAGEKSSRWDKTKKWMDRGLYGWLGTDFIANPLVEALTGLPIYNQGGRVGMQVGGTTNPYANLGYSWVNNMAGFNKGGIVDLYKKMNRGK